MIFVKWIAIVLVAGYLAGLALLYVKQRGMLFPIPTAERTAPAAAGFPEAEEHVLTTSDGVQDINHSFGLSAKSYITKPIDAERVGIVLGAVKYGDMPPRSGLHSVAM